MKIEILGMGCPKCKILYENTLAAVKSSGKQADVVKVEDLQKITDYAVMTTPALVIDGKVKSAGKVLSAQAIGQLLLKEGNDIP